MSWKWLVASISTLLTLVISTINIFHQYRNLANPKIQLCICRILTMIPVYAVLSYVSYTMVEYSVSLNIIRDCYEAYVMYSFLQLLTIYVGGDVEVVKILINSKNVSGEIWPQHYFNLKCIQVFGLNKAFHHPSNNSFDLDSNSNSILNIDQYNSHAYLQERKYKISRFYSCIKLGVLQFVTIKPLTAIVSLLLENIGYYKPGSFSFKDGFVYIITINVISVSISAYSLFLFYISLMKELLPIKPVLKFFCIKFIIFVSFWQSIILSMFSHSKIYSSKNPKYVVELHNWLLTIEMIFCAIVFGISFRVNKDINCLSLKKTNHNASDDGEKEGNLIENPNNNEENPFQNNLIRNQIINHSTVLTTKSMFSPIKTCTKKMFVTLVRIFDPLDIFKDSIFLFKSLKDPHYCHINQNNMHCFIGAIAC